MRVLLVNTSEHTGGAAVAANRLMMALHKNGVKAKMLVRDKTTDNINVATVPQSRLWQRFCFLFERLSVWMHNGLSRRNLFAIDMANVGCDITSTPEFREADIVHLHWINQGMLSLADIEKILRSGKPVVWTMHDLWPASGVCHYSRDCQRFTSECGECQYMRFSSSSLPRKVQQRKERVYDSGRIAFVTCSRWLRGEAEKSSLLQARSVTNIPNAIDTSVFCRHDKAEVRTRLGLPKDKRLILFSSAKVTDERKGLSFFVETCQLLSKSMGDSVAVVIMGAKSEVISQMIPLQVFSLGYITSEAVAAQAYSAVDLYVTPSLEDNLPNTIMEALACATPCVGFEVGGIPEMIDHKENGYVARYKDSADMAEGISWCLDPSRYDALCEAALHKVHTCYSQDAVATQYTKLYNKLLHHAD